MNLILWINFFIPIIFIVGFGFWLDNAILSDKEKMRKKLYRVK